MLVNHSQKKQPVTNPIAAAVIRCNSIMPLTFGRLNIYLTAHKSEDLLNVLRSRSLDVGFFLFFFYGRHVLLCRRG